MVDIVVYPLKKRSYKEKYWELSLSYQKSYTDKLYKIIKYYCYQASKTSKNSKIISEFTSIYPTQKIFKTETTI